jgi:hypothetical protein
LLTHSRGIWQRRRGQTDAGSWAARIVGRICGTVIVVIVLSSWPAIAATRGHAADPAPQKAPTSGGSSQPTPDPAPQATTTPPVTHRSTVTTPATRVPVVTTPARTVVVSPARTVTAPAAKVTSGPQSAHAARRNSSAHVRAHRPAAPHQARPQATRLSFPLALPRDLLLLPDTAIHAGEAGHRDGVLLLLSSLAMAALAVASFTLLRRLRRLELR